MASVMYMNKPIIMLVPSMNHSEICSQVKREYDKIYKTTILRLGEEYDRERKKLKIKKESFYPKEYAIKTAGKNNWIIFMHKGPGIEKYTGKNCIYMLSIVYYYSDKGLRVFYMAGEDLLVGFNAYFFKRYNERLGLNLSNPIDIVKEHLRKGVYSQIKLIQKNNRIHIIGFGIDGLRLGEVKYDMTYVEWKTFVSRDLTYRKQDEIEKELIEDLRIQIEEAVKDEMCNPRDIERKKNVYLSLTQRLTA